jgi:hypothetical protein
MHIERLGIAKKGEAERAASIWALFKKSRGTPKPGGFKPHSPPHPSLTDGMK